MKSKRVVDVGRVALLGQGLLFDAVEAALGPDVTRPDAAGRWVPIAAGRMLLVSTTDGWGIDLGEARRIARQWGVPWLPVHTELGCAVVGPIEVTDRVGCVGCAEARRCRALTDSVGHEAILQLHARCLAERPSTLLTRLGAETVAALVVAEAERLICGEPPETSRALLRVSLDDLAITRHTFLADPLCGVCGQLPDDSPEAARLVLASRPALPPGSFRSRPVAAELDTLTETYVDHEVGLISAVSGWRSGGLVVTSAQIGLRNGHAEAGYGRSVRADHSRLTALLEALERYGSAPAGRRTAVQAPYAEISDRALDPRSLGLYPADRHELSGFRFQPFSTTQPYRWVWGYSFARREPILVPETCAYYGVHHADDGPLFVDEISNGCALGSCLEEAILYGILEVAERDAFLMHWYAKLPAPRVDFGAARDTSLPLLAASIRADTGYRVLVFDISVEHRIPCAAAVAVNPLDDGRPALVCAAGSHPDPERAVRNALSELGPNLDGLLHRYRPEAERSRAMVADPAQVRTMLDHSLLYAVPAAAARLEFLTQVTTVRRLHELGRAGSRAFDSTDLRDNVVEAVGRYLDTGLDVIVVDQTAPEHRAGGFACVKVLIPGTLPMTFGHDLRRVDDLARLYEVPQLLGYRDRPLRPDEVNPYPHPFP